VKSARGFGEVEMLLEKKGRGRVDLKIAGKSRWQGIVKAATSKYRARSRCWLLLSSLEVGQNYHVVKFMSQVQAIIAKLLRTVFMIQ